MPRSSRRQSGARAGDEAFSKAIRLLAVRARSRHEIRQRLLRSSFSASDIRQAESRLVELGLLDDLGFARELVDAAMAAGKSRVWITQDLERRGVDAAVIDESLAAASGQPDDYERALEIARKRASLAREASPHNTCSRIVRYLCQRGYDGETAIEVSRRAVGEVTGGHGD